MTISKFTVGWTVPEDIPAEEVERSVYQVNDIVAQAVKLIRVSEFVSKEEV